MLHPNGRHKASQASTSALSMQADGPVWKRTRPERSTAGGTSQLLLLRSKNNLSKYVRHIYDLTPVKFSAENKKGVFPPDKM